MPKVSVIMGVYNEKNEEILKEAVISILKQTFKDFEFIICDDGSTNNSLDILKRLTQNDKRVILIKNEENRGLAYTLNKCLKIAKGEYIARMDSDDISDLDRFRKQVKILDDNPQIGVVNLNAYLFDENGKWGKEIHSEVIKKEDFLYNNPIIHPSVMIRKSAYDKVGGYRDIKMTYRVEDYDLFIRMYCNDIKMVTLQDFLFNYREDERNLKKRKFKYRINEMKVRYFGFKNMGLLHKKTNYLYVIKPLIVGILPKKIYKKIKKWRKSSKNEKK